MILNVTNCVCLEAHSFLLPKLFLCKIAVVYATGIKASWSKRCVRARPLIPPGLRLIFCVFIGILGYATGSSLSTSRRPFPLNTTARDRGGGSKGGGSGGGGKGGPMSIILGTMAPLRRLFLIIWAILRPSAVTGLSSGDGASLGIRVLRFA